MTRRIGILGGTGPEGSGLAYRWARAGEDVFIGSRDAQRAADTAAQIRSRIGARAKVNGAENARRVAFELTEKIPGARPVNGGKLENSRIVESLTALLIGINIRYKVHAAGIRFTGLPVR